MEGGETWIPKQWDADYSKFYHQSHLSATEITVASLKLFHKIQAGENAFYQRVTVRSTEEKT
jgi:hypothetical protein